MNIEQDDNIVLATSYRLIGTGFQMGARKLSESEELDEDGCPTKYTAIPLYHLASHSAELFLKSALLKRGVSEAELRKFTYRHNLEGLLDKLLEKKVPITATTQQIVRGLSEQHKDHILRYSRRKDGFIQMASFWPPVSAVFEALDEVMMATAISTHGV